MSTLSADYIGDNKRGNNFRKECILYSKTNQHLGYFICIIRSNNLYRFRLVNSENFTPVLPTHSPLLKQNFNPQINVKKMYCKNILFEYNDGVYYGKKFKEYNPIKNEVL